MNIFFSTDPDMEPVRLLGFSFGIHFCVGAGLARLEAKIAFEELLARFPGLTWQEDRVKRNFALFIVRGLETLPVRFGIH